MKQQSLLALLSLLCAGALACGAGTGWSGNVSVDNVTPGTTFLLQPAVPIAASTRWVEGLARTATVTADANGVSTITVFSLTEGQEQFVPWNYSTIPASQMPRQKTYTLTHEIKDGESAKSTETATVTVLPEPCLALVLGLIGLGFFSRSTRKAALALALLATAASGAATVTVTNVKCHQRWPWNGKIDIDYDVSSTATNFPTYIVSFSGKIGNGEAFALTALEGDGADGTLPATGTYRTTWNSSIDKSGLAVTNLIIGVTAEEQPPEPVYLKVDLVNRKYTEESAAPSSWSKDDKTKYMWFKWISACTNGFTMGSHTSEMGRWTNEEEHTVILSKGYFMAVFELTAGQYDYITAAAVKSDSDLAKEKISYEMLRGPYSEMSWPVSSYVTPDSVVGKLQALVAAPKGFRFDLPTESQWEYACRSKNYGSKWNDGSEILQATEEDENLDNLAWYSFTSVPASQYAVHAVGGMKTNDWGFYDMHGNVSEICLDWEGDYPQGPVTDPAGVTNGALRIARGGHWYDLPKDCRSARRGTVGPQSCLEGFGTRMAIVK